MSDRTAVSKEKRDAAPPASDQAREKSTPTPPGSQARDGAEAKSPDESRGQKGGQEAASGAPPERKERKLRAGPIILAIVIAAAALGALAFFGVTNRSRTTQQTQQVANQAAAVVVSVTSPERAPTSVQLDLPGQTQAYTQAPIYAQTNGYLRKWYFDIGAKVKNGDVLGDIDTPEVDQQLAQAKAQLKEAQASLDLSHTTYNRYQDLLKNKVISSQDFDNQAGDYRVKEATFNADDANVRRLEALENFKQLRAPFDGIVTSRNTDIGALINSGSGNPLFTVAQIAPLRVYVNVPESMARFVREGGTADLAFNSFPDRTFGGKVVRTSGAIDPVSRTLLTEIQVPNETGELFPGAYTQVHLRTDNNSNVFTVPANTLLFRAEGAAVAVVNADNKIEIRKVKIRRDLGSKLEIGDGLKPDDRVVVNPGDGFADGLPVTIKAPDKEGEKKQS